MTYPIRIHYPRSEGRIALRTELDWDASLEAARVDEDGTVWSFDVPADRPHFYFKPCLAKGDDMLWSVGSNYLGVCAEEAGRDVYPHFAGGTTGDVTRPIHVAGGGGAAGHRVRVYQPPGYDENTLKRYPVLYMHDGTNLFFPEESFLGDEWQIDETMDLLDQMNVIDKVLVVGIYAVDRMAEYTSPGYEGYARAIVERIKPMVDGGFRTLPGPSTTAVMGSSLGGLVSFYLGWQRPDVFGMAACLSSTFDYENDLFDRVRREPKRDVRFYLDSGWPEDNFEPTVTMRDLLVSRGYRLGDDLQHYAFPNALHNERFWAMRSHIPFQFFFGETPGRR